MTKAQKMTLIGTAGLTAVFVIWDLVLMVDDHEKNTISAVLGSYGWSASAVGYLCGHLWFSSEKPMRPSISFSVLGIATLAGCALDAVFAFPMGLLAGSIFWPNNRMIKRN